MALVVQNDDGDAVGANAFIDASYFDDYHTLRGNAAATGSTTDAKEVAIVKATDYINTRWRYRGSKISDLAFPRECAVDSSGDTVVGIPLAVKQATAEYALEALSGPLYVTPSYDNSGRLITAIRKEVVGAVVKDIKYDPAMRLHFREIPAGDQLIKASGLLRTGSTVDRG